MKPTLTQHGESADGLFWEKVGEGRKWWGNEPMPTDPMAARNWLQALLADAGIRRAVLRIAPGYPSMEKQPSYETTFDHRGFDVLLHSGNRPAVGVMVVPMLGPDYSAIAKAVDALALAYDAEMRLVNPEHLDIVTVILFARLDEAVASNGFFSAYREHCSSVLIDLGTLLKIEANGAPEA